MYISVLDIIRGTRVIEGGPLVDGFLTMFKFVLSALAVSALASSVVGLNILLGNDDSWASANIRYRLSLTLVVSSLTSFTVPPLMN